MSCSRNKRYGNEKLGMLDLASFSNTQYWNTMQMECNCLDLALFHIGIHCVFENETDMAMRSWVCWILHI